MTVEKRNIRLIPGLMFSALMAFAISCSYSTPETKNPTPGLENLNTMAVVQNGVVSMRKSFLGIEIDQKTNKWKNTRKTWLCGWAPVRDTGKFKNWRGMMATPYSSRHCNLEFHISTDGKNLEAREVRVNYPNYKDWAIMFTIPIARHYFYERDVDTKGREKNEFKKVTDRKNWQLSPLMDLEFSKIKFLDETKAPGVTRWSGSSIQNIFDIESTQHKGKNFLAFTATQTNSSWGNRIQKEIRYNFLEFKGTPGFKKTTYHQSAAKHMNILHILGGRPNGFDEVNYAAHWDLQEPVEFCLNDFPQDSRNYRQIGVDVIEEMNKAMTKIGAVKKGQKAFVVSSQKMKYNYDLRCPSITWVNDPQLSLGAPLGIGLVNTDIRTGEILWGGAVVWGGLIDYIVNRDSESVADAMVSNLHEMTSSVLNITDNPYFQDIGNQLQLKKWSPGFKSFNDMAGFSDIKSPTGAMKLLDHAISDGSQKISSGAGQKIMPEYKNGKLVKGSGKRIVDYSILSEALKFTKNSHQLELLKNAISENHQHDLHSIYGQSVGTENDHIHKIKSFSNLSATAEYTPQQLEKRNIVNKGFDGNSLDKLSQEFMSKSSAIHDADNLIENHYYAWQTATHNMSSLEKLAAARSVIKNVTLHELGHVVGLGHQFEGNRLPVKGTVPAKIYNELAQEAETHSNYTSIMDYMSGHTEVALPYEKVKMQSHDELVLSYLYNQKFSTYVAGDKNFTFFDIPVNGVIPRQVDVKGKKYLTTYMPQCSDIDAWLATSPYCRRWDRGFNAPSIVDENFKEYTDSFISRMNSFTEATGGSPGWANYRLWSSTYNLMNNNRTFYDHMRYELSDNEVYSSVFNKIKKNEKALLNFSKSCIDPSVAPAGWGTDFAKLALRATPEAAKTASLSRIQQLSEASSSGSELSYSNLLSTYKSVVNSKDLQSMDEKSYKNLEQELYKKGVTFTELQKLCRASKKSLSVAKTLLSLKGPDHININYNDAISPTGLRGGDATTDYSKMYGRYDQLGLLPVKVATLDLLTNTASTMRYGWWNVGKPKFNNSLKGKYGYFALYPEEFTDVIGTAVKNNMGFGGSILQDSASMSIANLYMSYFMFRTFNLSNDGAVNGFKSNYIEELKAQTQFKVALVPILLEGVTKEGKPNNKIFGFNPRVFNSAKRQLIDLPEAYVLPDRRAIIRGNDSEIIVPITKLRFLSQNAAYVWAFQVTYDNASYDDPLSGYTVKNSVSTLTTQELDKCMGGNRGLSSYFNSVEFEGFTVAVNIAVDQEAQRNFEKSVDKSFDEYHSRKNLKPAQISCEASEKGLGLISATALSLNGWILPQVYDYIRK